jgi:hypothetical protein
MTPDHTPYGQIKNHVLIISGNNPNIRVDGGCLVVSDGPMPVPADHLGPAQPAAGRMVTHRFRRAGCPVDRIVVCYTAGRLRNLRPRSNGCTMSVLASCN